MRIFKLKWFDKWSTKEKLKDDTLKNAISEISQGLIDADLGSHVYKKRIAIQGQGKSGGYRTIVTFKSGENTFFLYGFSKNERDNINAKELKAIKLMSKELLSYNEQQLTQAIKAGSLIEVK